MMITILYSQFACEKSQELQELARHLEIVLQY